MEYGRRIGRGGAERGVAGNSSKVVETQLDANGTAFVSLARQIIGQLPAQPHKPCREFRSVAHGMQIPFKGCFPADRFRLGVGHDRSEEHTSELQSLMRISYAVFCLKKKTPNTASNHETLPFCTLH